MIIDAIFPTSDRRFNSRDWNLGIRFVNARVAPLGRVVQFAEPGPHKGIKFYSSTCSHTGYVRTGNGEMGYRVDTSRLGGRGRCREVDRVGCGTTIYIHDLFLRFLHSPRSFTLDPAS